MANSITRTLIIAEAKRRGYTVHTIGEYAEIYRITRSDGKTEVFQGSRPMRTAANGHITAINKSLALYFIRSLGYDVLPFEHFTTVESAQRFLGLHAPIVVKPNNGWQSKGVTVGIVAQEQLVEAIDIAKKSSHRGEVVLQKQANGNLYRLLVINDKFVAAVLRTSAQVTGDGVHTVSELILEKNTDPRRGGQIDAVLKKIDIQKSRQFLGESTMARVLPKGESLKVSQIESVSEGGEAINVTDQVHQTWRDAAIRVSQATGLFICGFDIICPDISQPMNGTELPVLEINDMPGFKLHAYPTGGGDPIDVAKILFDELEL